MINGLLEVWYLCTGLAVMVACAYPYVIWQENIDVVDDICDIKFGGY